MAKSKTVDVEVEALLRFPWRGEPIFAGQRFRVSTDEARALIDEKFCGPVGSYRGKAEGD